MKALGKTFPYAQHVNTVCNDKIKNIPNDFNGIFIVEESYYETDGRRHASPHLFLITDSNDGIMLSSYEIPEGEDKNTFSYVSHFTPVMIFCLWEKFSEECLELSESMDLMERKPSDMMNRSFIKEYNDMKTKCSVQCTEHLK